MAFQKLKSTLPLLGINYPFDKDVFDSYCHEHIQKDIESSVKQIMPILQSCFEKHPALSYLYPLFHTVMRSAYLQAGRLADAGLIQAANFYTKKSTVLKLYIHRQEII